MTFLELAFVYPAPQVPERCKACRKYRLNGAKALCRRRIPWPAGIPEEGRELMGSIIIGDFSSQEALQKDSKNRLTLD